VAHFLCNFVNIILYTVLLVSVVAILGVETASVVALLASAGVAVGLALQGSLSNLAGGIMILIFHPFRVGNFIEAGGFSGTVIDIDIFYTVINTPDNKVVTVPNGTVMGGAITNYSVNDTRRVDLVFSVAYGTDAQKVIDVILDEAGKHEMVLKDPEAFCKAYDEQVAAAGGIGVQLLGVGRNGHIGFNEPGEELIGATHLTALCESTIDANSRFFATRDDVPRHAITMGMDGILSAECIVLVVSGKEKHDALMMLLSGKYSTNAPVTLLRSHKNVYVFCDEAAYNG
jgi:small-conductance mechanosensitive channel